MLWAVCCLGFFAFLRSGEFTVPSDSSFDPAEHLTPDDVGTDSHTSPTVLRVRIKQSKTDPLRQGVDIYLGPTYKDLCPITAMLSHLAVRRNKPGPLFVFQNGTPLTRQRLVLHPQQVLRSLDIDSNKYSKHRFRIGVATTATTVPPSRH